MDVGGWDLELVPEFEAVTGDEDDGGAGELFEGASNGFGRVGGHNVVAEIESGRRDEEEEGESGGSSEGYESDGNEGGEEEGRCGFVWFGQERDGRAWWVFWVCHS